MPHASTRCVSGSYAFSPYSQPLHRSVGCNTSPCRAFRGYSKCPALEPRARLSYASFSVPVAYQRRTSSPSSRRISSAIPCQVCAALNPLSGFQATRPRAALIASHAQVSSVRQRAHVSVFNDRPLRRSPHQPPFATPALHNTKRHVRFPMPTYASLTSRSGNVFDAFANAAADSHASGCMHPWCHDAIRRGTGLVVLARFRARRSQCVRVLPLPHRSFVVLTADF